MARFSHFSFFPSGTNTLNFTIVQPPRTRALSYTETDMANQFREVWNAAVTAGGTTNRPNRIRTYTYEDTGERGVDLLNLTGTAASQGTAATSHSLALPGITAFSGSPAVGSSQQLVIDFDAISGTGTGSGTITFSVTMDGETYSLAVSSPGRSAESGSIRQFIAYYMQFSSFAGLRASARIVEDAAANTITITSRRSVSGTPTFNLSIASTITGLTGYPLTPASTDSSATAGTGSEVDDIVRAEILSGDTVLATFVPTPIRQLLKLRGGQVAGFGAGGGKMAMPGRQPAGHLSVTSRTPGSRSTKPRR